MKAVAVFPGKPDSIHLANVPEPSVEDIPNGRGVLVEVLRVGVDGTDKEINAAEYGAAPEGYDVLVTGHESFGRVLEVGPNVRGIEPGDYVVATVRRPARAAVVGAGTLGLLATLALRLRGLEVTTLARTAPPTLNSELVEAVGARYVSTRQQPLLEAAEEHGPFDIIFEATGVSAVVFESMEALGRNGVLVLTGIAGGDRRVEVPGDRIMLGFVLGNKVAVGSVNANRTYFERGVQDMALAVAQYPGWLERLLTHPVYGLDNYAEMIRLLTEEKAAIKVFVEVNGYH